MPSPKPLKTATDSYVSSQRPKLNASNLNRLWVSAVAGNVRYAYIYFSLPYPKGSSILTGLLRVVNSKDISGSVTLTVSRITDSWTPSRVRYDNRPGVTNVNSVSVTKNNPAKGTVWEFDVMAMLQSMVSSDQWWGFRISTSFAGGVPLYSCNANEDFRPEFEVEWTDAPEAPDELSPSGGRAVGISQPVMSFNFQDEAGDTDLNACHIMFKGSNTGWDPDTGFSAPSWDSGVRVVSEPELDLAAIAAPALASGVLTWWTVAVQDGAGKWSQYSEPTSFKYLARPSVTLNSPGAEPNNYVEDTTPPIDWTVIGGTQTAYKVIIDDPDEPGVNLWSSGKVTSAVTSLALPKGVIRRGNKNYRLRLWVWDDVPREKNGDAPIYTMVSQLFFFQSSGTVTPPSTVTATQVSPWPWVDVSITRATMPDQFNILRDGEIIEANVEAVDIFTSGITYVYRDKMASPRESHVWSVQAVVNNQASVSVESGSIQTRLLCPVMLELDGTNPVYYMNPSVTPSMSTFQEAHQPLRGAKVLVTQYQGGYEGHLAGVLVDDILPGVDARTMRNRFKRWKKNPGKTYYLYLVDEVMKIVPYNMTYVPKAYSGGIKYLVEFDFFEVD